MSARGQSPSEERIQEIIKRLPNLTSFQINSIDRLISQLQRPKEFWRDQGSDLVTDAVLEDFGDTLRIHHVFSAQALSKDRFEYALERVLKNCGKRAELASRGNRGHDITVGNARYSLKTQANKAIKPDIIEISKFMELGKGDWTDKVSDLVGLRQNFFDHMEQYDRIFTLRRLKSTEEQYELVEVPKQLLQEAKTGELLIVAKTRQKPSPGYCTVRDDKGEIKFELYFDGGTERKLRIKNLRKNLCMVHATWKFPRPEADKAPIFEDEEGLD